MLAGGVHGDTERVVCAADINPLDNPLLESFCTETDPRTITRVYWMDGKAREEETPGGLLNIDDFDSLLGFALQSATSTEGAPTFSGPADEVGQNPTRLS